MTTKIAIAVTADVEFTPEKAIRGRQVPKGDGWTVEIESVPPDLPIEGTGPWLEMDSFGTWQRRESNNGSDAKFTATASGGYLVAAHRGATTAFLKPIQVWTE